ncbi:MAG: UbiX family flavin prenyltransferase [bacterium]
MDKKEPITLAITAASGIIFGIRTLEFLLRNDYKVELIISSKAYYIFEQELGIEISHDKNIIKGQILDYLDIDPNIETLKVWLDDEIWASPASGSYKSTGMIIAPASMASIASIASGLSENLISRTADVSIKEERTLVISPRETPFSAIHLENMLKLSKLRVKIVPPIIGFYGKIKTLEDGIDFVVGKTLDAAGIPNDLYERWS